MRDYLAIAKQYEDDVLAGTIPACQWVRLACERNRRDRARLATGDPAFPYELNASKAKRVCLTAEMLPHIKGPEAQVIGYDEIGRSRWATLVLQPWQIWQFVAIFGWVHRVTGLRRFRVALTLVPRKNGKSMMAAVVALFMLTADGESGAECYSAATTRDQAKVVAEAAWEMAKRSPEFCDFFGVRVGAKTTRTLEVPSTASKFMPLSADANSLDGLNVSFAAIDELHAHRTRAVWDVLDTATGARAQPLIYAITTAGVDLGGICYERMLYLEKVLTGALVDERFFGVNYTIDDGDEWRDVATLRKANPNYGVSVQPDDLERKVVGAQHSSASLNNFLTKHANVWVRAESTWAPMEAWKKHGDPTRTIEAYREYPCWIGVDLAEVRDIAAVVALFKLPDDVYAVFGRYYLPEATIAKSPIAQYGGWVHDQALIATTGDQADYLRIQADITAWCGEFKVQKVCFDRALAAQMGQELAARLGAKPEVVTVNQTVEVMNPSMQTVERLILAGKLQHNADPVLTWMMSNVVVQRNYKDEVYPRKAGGKDSPNKIDGPVALFTAMSQAAAAPAEEPQFQMLFVGPGRG
jgi:phage terminase large subunit-like protein